MLTDTNIRKTKPAAAPLKLSDGRGMYLLIKPDGGRYWRMNYRFDGKQKTLALGVYPTVTLADARQRREDARRLLANGTDPGEAKKAAKLARVVAAAISADTFEAVAREWLKKREASRETSAATIGKDCWRLETYLFPAIGSRPITEITSTETPASLLHADGQHEGAGRGRF